MAYALVYVFENVGEKDYWAVNDRLGLGRNGSGNWPSGLLSHAGGPIPKGWMVSEVWDAKASQEAFMQSRLGPALAAAKVPPPVQVIESVTAMSYPNRG
jgi:hypothetical protein